MKTKNFLILTLLALIPVLGFAQEWDDIYANPSQKRTYQNPQQPKKKVVVIKGDASNMQVVANGRDVDEYNRRAMNDTLSTQQDSEYQDYQYTDRIVRFHDPESSVRITGADEVTIYMNDDAYSDYYNYRDYNYNYGYFGGYSYPWYNSYYPWYTSRPYYYYSAWYSPWRFGYYDPWYYGGYYDPWYYGYGYGYYPYYGYGGGYYHGYYHGYYNGYYSNIPRNTSGRTSGIYRTEVGSRNAYSGLSSGRSVYSRSNGDYSGSRTRVIDGSGRVMDSRNGRVIDSYSRSSSMDRGSSVYSRGSYEGSRNTRVYERSSVGSSSRSYDSSNQRSSYNRSNSDNSYTPSRSSYDRSSSRSYDSSSSRSSSYGSGSSSSRSYDSGSSSRSTSGRSGGGR